MLKNLQLFVDFICPKELYPLLIAVTGSSFSSFSFKVKHLETLEEKECKYDLVVFDMKGQPLSTSQLQNLVDAYDNVFLLNAPSEHDFYKVASDYKIRYILREPFWIYEYEMLFKRYLMSKTTELEHNLFQKLLESAQNSIVMTDVDGKIMYANPYFENISGYTLEELVNKSPNVIKSHYHDLTFYDTLWQTITRKQVWEGIFVNLSKSEELFYEEATITPLLNAHGEVERFLKIGKNITREKLLLDQLSKEVKLARSVVNTLLPKFYKDERIEFDYHMLHYNEIGGDFIYFNNMSSSLYHFALIDVIGHGVSSALVAMTLTQMFKDYIEFLDLNQTVRSINQLLTRLNNENEDSDIYVTGVFVEFDFKNQSYQLINAGHPDVLILTSEVEIQRAPSTNMILGVEEQREYHMYTGSLTDISKILCYTDGLYESNDIPYEHALTMLEESLKHLSNQHFYESLLHAFLRNAQINDDITIVKIELTK